MAKKRVHEIAKEKGIPSKEVLAKPQAAGLDVKAAASSVDEADIERAFNGDPAARPTGEPHPPPGPQPRAAADGDSGKPATGAPQGGGKRPRPTRGEAGP